MPSLLPDILNDDFLNEEKSSDVAVETGRQFLNVADATNVVSAGTLVLGIIFIVTTLTLYAYYYATTFDLTSSAPAKRSFGNGIVDRSGESLVYNFPAILEDLDSAYKSYGIEEMECQKKIICESQLPNARSKNPKVADHLSNLVSRAMDTSLAKKGQKSSPEQDKVDEFVRAARSGHHFKSCEKYSCENQSLEQIKTQ